MNEIIKIDGAVINQDADGRYCLNDLHRAAGSENKHRPSYWAENVQTKELAEEIGKAGIPALTLVKGGIAPGTYVCKEMVYAYAMWISPVFHLKVIRAYDVMAARPSDLMAALADPAAMRGLLLTYTEKVLALQDEVSTMAPKVAAFDRISTFSDGCYGVREVAKMLDMQEKHLKQKLQEFHWFYRHPMGKSWLGYDPIRKKGYVEHKRSEGDKPDGGRWESVDARITAKGLLKLAELLGKELESA